MIINKNVQAGTFIRIIQHWKQGSFALISAFIPGPSEKENQKRTEELIKDVRGLGFGYMKSDSSYESIPEKSLFIQGIPKDQARDLARKYGQFSFIWAKDETWYEIRSESGEVLHTGDNMHLLNTEEGADSYSRVKKHKFRLTHKLKSAALLSVVPCSETKELTDYLMQKGIMINVTTAPSGQYGYNKCQMWVEKGDLMRAKDIVRLKPYQVVSALRKISREILGGPRKKSFPTKGQKVVADSLERSRYNVSNRNHGLTWAAEPGRIARELTIDIERELAEVLSTSVDINLYDVAYSHFTDTEPHEKEFGYEILTEGCDPYYLVLGFKFVTGDNARIAYVMGSGRYKVQKGTRNVF
jgi:hypothetical protein